MNLAAPFETMGRITVPWLRGLGALTLVLGRTLRYLPTLSLRECLRSLVLYGYQSLALTVGVGTLVGATVVIQAGIYAERFGARQYLGWAAGYAVLWEFGPLLLGLVMAGRIGARNAAELSLLKVNGQLEGLRGISLDPFRLLIAPRVVASALAITCLATITYLVAVIWETVAAYLAMRLPARVFLSAFSDMLRWHDIAGSLLKTFAFGIAIALVSTTVGLRAQGGARGVGRASASAVVYSCGAIFALDFLLTPLLARWLT